MSKVRTTKNCCGRTLLSNFTGAAFISLFLVIFVMVFLPSCVKYYDFIPGEVPQWSTKKDLTNLRKSSLRKVRIYDEFSTVAIFDIMWFSDLVKVKYVNFYAKRVGLNKSEKLLKMRRLFEENKDTIKFFVLAEVHGGSKIPLGEKNSEWSFRLLVGDRTILPKSIREIDLDPEVALIFGENYNKFKTPYLVSFPAHPDGREDSGVVYDGENKISFVIASNEKKAVVSWKLPGKDATGTR